MDLQQRFFSFIEKSNLRYNHYYDYSKVIYVNNDTKVEIICPEHGSFFQIPNNHLKHSCSKCNFFKEKNRKKAFIKFVDESNVIHDNRYKYIENSFTRLSNKVKIICPIHGEFNQVAFRHKSGSKCKICDIKIRADHQKLNEKTAIDNLMKIHGSKYDYSNVNYLSYNKKIKIICPIHGEFIQRYDVHLSGCGCQKCMISIGEQQIIKFLNEKNIKYLYNHSFRDCKNINALRFDFYCKSENICIEFDGIQHFKSIDYFGGEERFTYMKKCDLIKNEYCLKNNINLIRISYKDENIFNSLNKKIFLDKIDIK